MKKRLCHWPSTLIGLGLLAFLGFMCWINPALLKDPQSLVVLAGGLYALFVRGKSA
jgi:hypothetical protein